MGDFILVRFLFVLIFGVTSVWLRPADTPLWSSVLLGVGAAIVGIVLALIPSWIFVGFAAARIAIDRGDNSVFLRTSTWYADAFLFAQIVLAHDPNDLDAMAARRRLKTARVLADGLVA